MPIQIRSLVVAVQNGDNKHILEYINGKVNLNWKDKHGFTLLAWAVQMNQPDVIRLLIKQGADPNKDSTWGGFPLRDAAADGNLNMVNLLLKLGADINHISSRGGDTALTAAVAYEQVRVSRCLVRHHADVNISDQYGYTPLHFATEYGNIKIIKMLLEGGARKDVINSDGVTPLDMGRKSTKQRVRELYGMSD